NAVVFHEAVERFAGNAAEPGARHPEALELSVVEATDDGLLADLTDFGGLAGRENGLHAYPSLLACSQSHEFGPLIRLSVKTPGTEILHDMPLIHSSNGSTVADPPTAAFL